MQARLKASLPQWTEPATPFASSCRLHDLFECHEFFDPVHDAQVISHFSSQCLELDRHLFGLSDECQVPAKLREGIDGLDGFVRRHGPMCDDFIQNWNMNARM